MTEEECSCEIESIIDIDERGQMVLPKEIRKKLDLDEKSKLAIVSMTKNDEICCISLMKTENLEDMVKEKLKPVIGNL